MPGLTVKVFNVSLCLKLFIVTYWKIHVFMITSVQVYMNEKLEANDLAGYLY